MPSDSPLNFFRVGLRNSLEVFECGISKAGLETFIHFVHKGPVNLLHLGATLQVALHLSFFGIEIVPTDASVLFVFCEDISWLMLLLHSIVGAP